MDQTIIQAQEKASQFPKNHQAMVRKRLRRFAVWRVFRNGDSSPVGVWDVDLQGFTQGFALREPKFPDSEWTYRGKRLKPQYHRWEQSVEGV